MTKLSNRKVAILATDGYEQSELEKPRDALLSEGAEVHIVSLKTGQIRGWDESVVDALIKVRGDRPLSANLNTIVDEMLGEDGAARSKALILTPKKAFFKR